MAKMKMELVLVKVEQRHIDKAHSVLQQAREYVDPVTLALLELFEGASVEVLFEGANGNSYVAFVTYDKPLHAMLQYPLPDAVTHLLNTFYEECTALPLTFTLPLLVRDDTTTNDVPQQQEHPTEQRPGFDTCPKCGKVCAGSDWCYNEECDWVSPAYMEYIKANTCDKCGTLGGGGCKGCDEPYADLENGPDPSDVPHYATETEEAYNVRMAQQAADDGPYGRIV